MARTWNPRTRKYETTVSNARSVYNPVGREYQLRAPNARQVLIPGQGRLELRSQPSARIYDARARKYVVAPAGSSAQWNPTTRQYEWKK